MANKEKTKIIYWILTGLLSAFIIMASLPDVLVLPEAVVFFKQLGFPKYLLPFIGIAKLSGVAALLIPGFPKIREWAYAGLFFDLLGALYSNLAAGNPISASAPAAFGLILLMGSYFFYHRQRWITGNKNNRQVLTEIAEQFAKGNIDFARAHLAEDIKWNILGEDPVIGKTQVIEVAKMAQLQSYPVITISKVIAEDNFVVLENTGKSKTKNGVLYNQTYCDVFEFKNDKLQEITTYLDTALSGKVNS